MGSFIPHHLIKRHKKLNNRSIVVTEENLPIKNLPYLTMCIKESMRMNPPVPNIARRLTRDVPFPDGNVAPAGK